MAALVLSARPSTTLLLVPSLKPFHFPWKNELVHQCSLLRSPTQSPSSYSTGCKTSIQASRRDDGAPIDNVDRKLASPEGSSSPDNVRVAPSSTRDDVLTNQAIRRSDLTSPSRRAALLGLSAVALSQATGGASVSAGYGRSEAAEAGALEGKQTGLPVETLKSIIARDISEGQYFITGDLTRSIYREGCRFQDPTNTTAGLSKYLAAVSILFDPSYSKQELLSIEVTADQSVTATWRLGGYLKFPWSPRVAPFTGSTTYEFDENGLVELHNEKWDISPVTALLETLTPSFGPKELMM